MRNSQFYSFYGKLQLSDAFTRSLDPIKKPHVALHKGTVCNVLRRSSEQEATKVSDMLEGGRQGGMPV